MTIHAKLNLLVILSFYDLFSNDFFTEGEPPPYTMPEGVKDNFIYVLARGVCVKKMRDVTNTFHFMMFYSLCYII